MHTRGVEKAENFVCVLNGWPLIRTQKHQTNKVCFTAGKNGTQVIVYVRLFVFCSCCLPCLSLQFGLEFDSVSTSVGRPVAGNFCISLLSENVNRQAGAKCKLLSSLLASPSAFEMCEICIFVFEADCKRARSRTWTRRAFFPQISQPLYCVCHKTSAT